MQNPVINFGKKLAMINEHWTPRVVAEMNDYQFKLVKIKGEFVWHSHAETDETFIVIKGHLKIELKSGEVNLGPGEMYVVPKGVEHKPVALEEVELLLIEPRGVLNTGDEQSELTAENDVWI